MSNWLGSRSTPLAQLQQPIEGDAAGVRAAVAVEQGPGDPADELGVEALVARGDGGVDREHAVTRDGRPRGVDGGATGDQLTRPLGEEERRVALVEVPDRGRDAELPQGAHAAHAQHQLLVEAHLPATHVQDVRDRTVRVVVLGQVRVQEQDRHPPDLRDPHGGEQLATGQLDADRQGTSEAVLGPQDRQPRELEVRIGVLLVPVGVDRLAEEAAAVHEPDADQGQGHVRGGLHVIAGEDAEAAGVDAQRLVEPVLRAEVGDRPVARASPCLRSNQWSDPFAM